MCKFFFVFISLSPKNTRDVLFAAIQALGFWHHNSLRANVLRRNSIYCRAQCSLLISAPDLVLINYKIFELILSP